MLPPRGASANARAAFLQLPSHLRLLSHQQSARSFSASPSRKFDFAEAIAAPPLTVLHTLHAVGIPWYAAIPTAAILIRGVFGYFAASAPARRRQQIRNHLTPLTAARTALDLKLKDAKDANSTNKPDPGIRRADAIIQGIRNSHKTGKRFGGGLISRTSFINFPTLIATTEAVRLMCGAREGLLSTLAIPFNWIGRMIAPSYFVDPTERFSQMLARRMELVREARVQQAQEQGLQTRSGGEVASDNVFHSLEAPQLPPMNTESAHFQPSLQTEGFSWCTDLTLPDSTALIPGLVMATMWANILLNPQPVPRLIKSRPWMPEFMRGLLQRYSTGQFVGLTLAYLFYFILKDMPAALALYLLASTLTAAAQKKVLEWMMPMRRAIMPCVRGTRIRSKKEWSTRQ